MGLKILIGQVVLVTKGTLQGIASIWDPVSQFNKKQNPMALSSAKAQYMAANSTSCEDIWVHKLLALLTNQGLDATIIYCDS